MNSTKKILPIALGLIFLVSYPLLSFAGSPEGFRSGGIRFSGDCSVKGALPASNQEICASDPVTAKSPTTFLDLLRQIYPDIRPDGKASQPGKQARKSLGQMELSQGTELQPATGSSGKTWMPAGDFSYLSVAGARGTRTVILERSSGNLAYFQVTPTLKLLDLVGIAQDQQVSIAAATGVYPLKSGPFLFWTNNSHFNSGESFNIYNLIAAGEDKIEIVYDGPFLYGFSAPGTECHVGQTLNPVTTTSSDEKGYPRLALKVSQEKVCQHAEKQVVTARRKFGATLTWDQTVGKYMGGSKKLFQLNRCRIDGKANCGF